MPTSSFHEHRVAHSIPAMLASWARNERCLFSNAAYKTWFGRNPEEMSGIDKNVLLGPIYQKSLPFIRGALEGKRQEFERKIVTREGTERAARATYIPDFVDGAVHGFTVHVSDLTTLPQREEALYEVLRDTIQVLRDTKRSFRSKELGDLRAKLEFFLGK